MPVAPLFVKVLGAGRHVGKSCFLIHINGTNILVDCGIQITHSGQERYPDLASLWPPSPDSGSRRCIIDAVFITHYHIDHLGALPHLVEVLGYDGPIFMTRASGTLGRLLLQESEVHVNARKAARKSARLQSPQRNIPVPQYNNINIPVTVAAGSNSARNIGYSPPAVNVPPWSREVVEGCGDPAASSPGNGYGALGRSEEAEEESVELEFDDDEAEVELLDSSNGFPLRGGPGESSGGSLLHWSCESGDVQGTGEVLEATVEVASQNIVLGKMEEFYKVSISAPMLASCFSKITYMEFGEPVAVGGSKLRVTAYPAGHVPGAAMFVLESAGQSVLYTGDFTTSNDRLLGALKVPSMKPSLLISEATYASQNRDSKEAVGRDICMAAESCVRGGGKVLIPISAVGKAQEMATLLALQWQANGLDVPIYLTDKMMVDCFKAVSLLPGNEALGSSEDAESDANFPFLHLDPTGKKAIEASRGSGPMVALATSRVLDCGLALLLFRSWAGDERNTVILPGFCLPGTVGHQLLLGKKQIELKDGSAISVKCKVRYFSIAAHADSTALQLLVRTMGPQAVMLVHGEAHGMQLLADLFRRDFGLTALTPIDNEIISFSTYLCERGVTMELRSRWQEALRIGGQNRKSIRDHLLPMLQKKKGKGGGKKKAGAGVTTKPAEEEVEDATLKERVDKLIEKWCPSLLSILDNPAPVDPSFYIQLAMNAKPQTTISAEPPSPPAPSKPAVEVAEDSEEGEISE